MRPIFTLHAGEYLVGDYLEKKFKDCRVWLPSKDTGVDLLVTDTEHRQAVSLQVKFSKDFMNENFEAFGWWTLKSHQIATFVADLWVFALYSFNEKKIHNVIINPKNLLEILQIARSRAEVVSNVHVCQQQTSLLGGTRPQQGRQSAHCFRRLREPGERVNPVPRQLGAAASRVACVVMRESKQCTYSSRNSCCT